MTIPTGLPLQWTEIANNTYAMNTSTGVLIKVRTHNLEDDPVSISLTFILGEQLVDGELQPR